MLKLQLFLTVGPHDGRSLKKGMDIVFTEIVAYCKKGLEMVINRNIAKFIFTSTFFSFLFRLHSISLSTVIAIKKKKVPTSGLNSGWLCLLLKLNHGWRTRICCGWMPSSRHCRQRSWWSEALRPAPLWLQSWSRVRHQSDIPWKRQVWLSSELPKPRRSNKSKSFINYGQLHDTGAQEGSQTFHKTGDHLVASPTGV